MKNRRASTRSLPAATIAHKALILRAITFNSPLGARLYKIILYIVPHLL